MAGGRWPTSQATEISCCTVAISAAWRRHVDRVHLAGQAARPVLPEALGLASGMYTFPGEGTAARGARTIGDVKFGAPATSITGKRRPAVLVAIAGNPPKLWAKVRVGGRETAPEVSLAADADRGRGVVNVHAGDAERVVVKVRLKLPPPPLPVPCRRVVTPEPSRDRESERVSPPTADARRDGAQQKTASAPENAEAHTAV